MAGEEIDCVMPAAGRSERMGEWKLTLPIDSVPMVERSVRAALHVCSRVILVTGFRGEELSGLFSGWSSVKLVANPDYDAGMFSSIRAGVRFVRTERFFISLADMPYLSADIYRSLLAIPHRSDAPAAARPYSRGRRGHPVLFSSAMIDKILQFDNAHTMQEVLQGIPVSRIEVDDDRVIRDIDTPEDYAHEPGPL